MPGGSVIKRKQGWRVANWHRPGKERLPEQALLTTHSKLELSSSDVGFDSLHYVYIDPDGNIIVEDYNNEIWWIGR